MQHCSVCQQAKYSTQPQPGLLQPLPILEQIWQDVAMNFIIGLPPSYGCSVILVVIDKLSKFAHFIPLPARFSAKMVVDTFIQHVVKIHGIPQSIVSDRDRIFTSAFWQEIFKKQGT